MTALRSDLLEHLSRGGAFGYFWTAPAKRTTWWAVDEPAPVPNGRQNIYFGVHPTATIPETNSLGEARDPKHVRGRNEHIAAVNCLFAEFDAKDFSSKAEALAHVKTLTPAPSVVIDSGGGYHVYWLLHESFVIDSDERRQRAADVQAVWVERAGGDTGAKDLARVLRVPGTTNYKPAYKPDFPPVSFVEADFQRLYDFDTLAGMVEHLIAPPAAPLPRAPRPNGNGNAYAQAALEQETNELAATAAGGRNARLNKAAFSLGQLVAGGHLSESEVERSLEHACQQNGLIPDDGQGKFERTLRSGLAAGKLEPRHPPIQTAMESDMKSEKSEHGELSKPDLPRIVIKHGELPALVRAAEDAMLKYDPHGLFQRSGQLVRPIVLPERSENGGIIREAGSTILHAVDEPWLRLRFSESAEWMKWNKRNKEYHPYDCPAKISKIYMSLVGDWRVLPLMGLIEAPTLRADGSILETPGYDPATGLYFATQGSFPAIPRQPDRVDAANALRRLWEPFTEFPFEKEEDKSVVLVAAMTALIRKSLYSAPLFAFSAPTMGTGKSLLVDVVSIIATGRPAPVMSQGKDATEDEKRILSLLMAGDPIVCIDNVERPIQGDTWSMILTQPTFMGRILGKSQVVRVPTNMTFMATGNNLTLMGDMTTRTLLCRIDAKMEKPEERKFEGNLREQILAQRGELVQAALTVLRAYHVAGRPPQDIKPFGRFEEWSDWVRSALVWLNEADPNATRKRIDRGDPEQQQLAAMTQTWHSICANRGKTSREVIDDLAAWQDGNNMEMFEDDTNSEDWEALYSAVESVAGGRGGLSSRRLGNWLSKMEGRISGGLYFAKGGDHQGVALWHVLQI